MDQPQQTRARARFESAGARLGVVVAALLCAQVVGAQTPTELSVDSSNSGPEVTVTTNLSPEQQIQQGEEILSAIVSVSESVNRQLRAARGERDVVKVLCLNDKLNQIDVALRSAKDRMSALRTALQRRDADRARHEFTVLDVLRERIKTLEDESGQCVGEETGFVGEAEVSVTIDPNLPDGASGGGGEASAAPPPPASTASGIE